jgi:hypothetical protein
METPMTTLSGTWGDDTWTFIDGSSASMIFGFGGDDTIEVKDSYAIDVDIHLGDMVIV